MKKISELLWMVTITLLLLSSCARKPVLVKFDGETQGTYYAVTYYANDGPNYQLQIDSLLHRFDSSASLWKPNSILSRINNNDSVKVDETLEILFNKSMKVSEESSGAFDITVGPLVSAWGFGFNDRLKVNQLVIDSLLPLVNYHNLTLSDGRIIKSDPRIRLDFNAIAQGYAVDLVAGFLESKGISSYLIDIGGEVFGKGTKPDKSEWNVGIELPAPDSLAERQVKAIVMLKDKALSTSGNYRKYYEENGVRYSHTINPATGYPVKHSLLSVSVLAPDCMTADAYATVMMVKGLEHSRQFLDAHPGVEAYFIYSDSTGAMKTWFTPGFTSLIKEEL